MCISLAAATCNFCAVLVEWKHYGMMERKKMEHKLYLKVHDICLFVYMSLQSL